MKSVFLYYIVAHVEKGFHNKLESFTMPFEVIDSEEKINMLHDTIKKMGNYGRVVVTNFIPLNEEI